MRYFLDTNVLLRLVETAHPFHKITTHALKNLKLKGAEFCISLQNASEFWNVCTRPLENNGLNQSIDTAAKHLARFEQLFLYVEENSEVYRNWIDIIVRYSVVGVKVHDAKIVALMMAHNIQTLLTFNAADFKRFSEIVAVSPKDIA